jgi:hypothetical protein
LISLLFAEKPYAARIIIQKGGSAFPTLSPFYPSASFEAAGRASGEEKKVAR